MGAAKEDLSKVNAKWSPGQSVTPVMPCPHGIQIAWNSRCIPCEREKKPCPACGRKESEHVAHGGLCPPKGT